MTPGDKHLYRKLFAEFLGTAYLVATICLSKGYNEAVPAIIVSVTASTGMISGAFYNPAVALGSLVKVSLEKGVDWATVKLYGVIILLEFFAALTGAFYASVVSNQTYWLTKNPECSTGGAFLAEVMGSAQLVAMAMMVNEHRPHKLVGVCCVAASVLATIQWKTSGAVMNPALGFGIKLADASHFGSGRLDNLWIYLTAPFIGGVLGSLINSVYMSELVAQRPTEPKQGLKESSEEEEPLLGVN
jgi:aquaporin Z